MFSNSTLVSLMGVTLIGGLILLFYSCKTTKIQQPTEYPEAQIRFGNGGGFSGMVTEYALFDNGQLLKKQTTQDSFTLVKKIEKNLVKQIFKNYDFLKLSEVKYNQPGNMYHFIKFQQSDKNHEMIWGNQNYPNDQVRIFHSTLIAIIKKDNK